MAVKEEKCVFNMPMDEAGGSTKAYDYSVNRADGVLKGGAAFVAGKQGNCIEFDGTGSVEVEQNVLDFTAPFSLCMYVNPGKRLRTYSVLFNYDGKDCYYEFSVGLAAETWYYLVITHEEGDINVYLNGTLIKHAVVSLEWGSPIGVSINQDDYSTLNGKGKLDEVKFYQQAFTQNEVQDLLDKTKQLAYKLDGVDFKQYGVHVSASKGLVDVLKMKDPMSVNFDGYHGEAVDLSRPRFEARIIKLDCFMHVEGGKMAFVQEVKAFFAQFFNKHKAPTPAMEGTCCPAGLHRLIVDIHPTKPLIYEVYMPEATEVIKTWDDNKMVGTFSLQLKEPEPVKKVLKHLRVNEATKRVSIKLTTSKLINVYWGDGTMLQDVYGTDVTITHDYTVNGDYFIVITGVIEDIKNLETNAIVVWDKL